MRSFIVLCLCFILFRSDSNSQDTVEVYTGWNMIGSLKEGAVPDILLSDPDSIITTSFFGYNPVSGYSSADILGRGYGYWVKVSADGVIIFPGSEPADCGGPRVIYEGAVYHTIKIGSQCWLEENLNVGSMIIGSANQVNDGVIRKYCYLNDTANCAIYGGLYQWDEAMQYDTAAGSTGICPPGWHIPTQAEFETLVATVGADGNALKAVGQGSGPGAGTNTSGFSGLLGGIRDNSGLFEADYFQGKNTSAYFTGSTQLDPATHISLSLSSGAGTASVGLGIQSFGFSVRCIRD